MKRGSILDLAFVIVILLIIFGSIPILTNMLGQMATATATSPLNSSRFSQNMTALKGTIETTVDGSFVILAFGLIIVVLITSSIVYSSPIFFVIGIIMLLITLVFSMGMSNVAQTLAGSGTINYTNYPLSMLIMGNLPIIIAIVGFALIIIYFAKRNSGGVVDV